MTMVTKSQKTGAKKGRVKVGSLKLNRETVKDLTGEEKKKIKGKLAGVNVVQGKNATIATCCNCSYSGCASF
jgi:dihydroxyacetone kinase DhaKLM complex PTS-EIIA-like component DhaM